jgi:hypothetical protein
MLKRFNIPSQPQEEVDPVFGPTFHWLLQLQPVCGPLGPTLSTNRFHLVVTSSWRQKQVENTAYTYTMSSLRSRTHIGIETWRKSEI